MSEIVFLALSPGSNSKTDRAIIKTPSYDLSVVVVPDYSEAIKVAKDAKDNGAKFIELCGGFGDRGVCLIKESVPDVYVGVVRFDIHPGMNNESGDITYGK